MIIHLFLVIIYGDDELFNKVGKYAKFANDEIDEI